jgi:23S rRNA pseudouridine2604 synthase
MTKRCRVERIDRDSFRIILTQGLNRQIRRMCSALGYRVQRLKRVRIMNIELGALRSGEWRDLTDGEIRGLPQVARKTSAETPSDHCRPAATRQSGS